MSSNDLLLLKTSRLRYKAPDFTQVQLQDFLPAFQQSLLLARKRIDQIKQQTSAPNFENTIMALESAADEMSRVGNLFHCLHMTDANDEMHQISREISKISTEFSSDISMDEVLFERVQKVWSQHKQLSLSPEELALTKKTFKSFERNGAKLPKESRSRLREIDLSLGQLSISFSEHLLKATSEYALDISDSAEMKGLPSWFVESAKAKAESRGKTGWTLTLDAPSFLSVMKYAESRRIREEIWRAYSGRCTSGPYDNRDIVQKMVGLRHERARLLGFETHAHYVLEERMAQTPTKVFEFLKELKEFSMPAALREMAELHSFARAEGGPSDLMPWDTSYYAEKLKTQKFSIDQESLRPYFQLEKVLEGAFALAGRLYDIQFKLVTDLPVYHKEAQVYEVSDSTSGSFLGLLYTDFFPRDSKRAGAWCMTFQEQGLQEGTVCRPQLGIVGNFTKPTEHHGSLLTFDEVRTLFHEFGHALHGLLSQCQYRSTGGLNVFWDFVELPSQFMENWVFEPEILKNFARHYKTGEVIPNETIQKIRESSSFLAGLASLRQITFAILDMTWHCTDPASHQDVLQFENQTVKPYLVLPQIDGANISCSFGHVFAGGYSAGYYSYKWAEVLEADAFSHFKETGLFDKSVATRFRTEILSRGGTYHPMELYKNFRGREPDIQALLHREGLLPNTAPGETR